MNDLGKEQMESVLAQQVSEVIGGKEVPVLEKRGISIVCTKDSDSGLRLASDILHRTVDEKTLLLLSGGLTPKPLYEQLAKAGKLHPGAVGLTDERIGPIEFTNEKMIRDTRLVGYLERIGVSFFSIRRPQIQTLEQTASGYNGTLESLFKMYPRKIAILGMGADGHIASIVPNREGFVNPVFGLPQNVFVSGFKDPKNMIDGGFGRRVTMTFRALREMDLLICLVFGANKSHALERMFGNLPKETVPASFLTSHDVAKKVILITDQKI